MHESQRHRSSSSSHNLKALRHALLALTVVLLGACSARQAYNGMQESRRTECLTRPPTQQTECMADTRISFEEYQRRRAEVVKKETKTE